MLGVLRSRCSCTTRYCLSLPCFGQQIQFLRHTSRSLEGHDCCCCGRLRRQMAMAAQVHQRNPARSKPIAGSRPTPRIAMIVSTLLAFCACWRWKARSYSSAAAGAASVATSLRASAWGSCIMQQRQCLGAAPRCDGGARRRRPVAPRAAERAHCAHNCLGGGQLSQHAGGTYSASESTKPCAPAAGHRTPQLRSSVRQRSRRPRQSAIDQKVQECGVYHSLQAGCIDSVGFIPQPFKDVECDHCQWPGQQLLQRPTVHSQLCRQQHTS